MGAAGADPRDGVPNILLQMLLRGSNAVGYTNYPDNVVQDVRRPVRRTSGIDVFRVFDSLNWVENMRVAIDAVQESGKLVRGGHLLHRRPARPGAARSTTSSTMSASPRSSQKAGTHILGIKDMAGLRQAGRRARRWSRR